MFPASNISSIKKIAHGKNNGQINSKVLIISQNIDPILGKVIK